MKFWLFQNNQVNGPYEPEDLSRLPAYSPESLVCPEGRKGTSMGDWQRAGMIPELSVSLLKASAGAGAAKGSGASSRYDFPPEPTLKDLAALGSLQEKFSMLENTVAQLQEEMRRKDSELSELDKELGEKTKAVADLNTKLGGIEDRVAHIAVLQGELDKAVAAEKEVAGNVEAHRLTLTRLNEQIDKLKADVTGIDQRKAETEELTALKAEMKAIDHLKDEVHDEAGEIEKLKADVREIDQLKGQAGDIETLKAGIKDLEKLREEFKELEAKQSKSPPPHMPAEAPSLAKAGGPPPPPPPVSPPPAPVPMPFEFSPLAQPGVPETKFPPLDTPPIGMGLPAAGAEASKTPPAGIPGVIKDEPKPAKSKAPFIAAAAVLLATAGLYFSGILKPKKTNPPPLPAESQPLPPPTTQQMEVKPPPVSPEVQEEQFKAAAVSLVKDWPAPGGSQSLGQQLEAAFPSTGGLAPWMAEKTGAGTYQVNYYAPKSAAGQKQAVYEFEARLGEMKVLPHNEAAQVLLSGAKPPAKKKKIRVKAKPAKSADVGDDLFQGMPGIEPDKAAQPRKEEEAPAADLMLPPARKPAAPKRKGKASSSGKAADAELLDDLLKP